MLNTDSKLSYLLMFNSQGESAMTLIFGWLERMTMREGWRFVLMEFGAQCVMTFGITGMQQWCVDNWDTQGVSLFTNKNKSVWLISKHNDYQGGLVVSKKLASMSHLG